MNAFMYILIFTFGIVFGSFFNVVIYRLPEGKSIVTPRSSCGKCGTTLSMKDLVPIFSYIFLKGKCRYCSSKIHIRYPLVELLTGLVFVVLYAKYDLSIEFLFTLYLMCILIIVFFIDLDHMIIPNELVIAGLIGGVVFFVLRFWYNDTLLDGARWYSPILGMVVTSGFLLLVAIIGKLIYGGDAFGMGDVKIFLPIGLILGLKLGIMALVFSIFVGGISGLILIITRKKERKSQIPFGPFIVIGSFLSILFGHGSLSWYIGLL
jgi:leader peptidase (prepilin peptidase)/N-methyltransferase